MRDQAVTAGAVSLAVEVAVVVRPVAEAVVSAAAVSPRDRVSAVDRASETSLDARQSSAQEPAPSRDVRHSPHGQQSPVNAGPEITGAAAIGVVGTGAGTVTASREDWR
jgi:hypothetical protein